ncbi:MAG: hypothetical protein M3Q81_05250, partial [bacterium]|nr:hypothetical protein [bacterium]
TKIIVTSATIDTEKFRNFFGAAEPIIAYNEQLYPVEVQPVQLRNGEHHTPGAIRAVKDEVLTKWSDGTLTIPNTAPDGPPTKVTKGSVLVLLPGKDDIQNAMKAIASEVERLGIKESVEILECHGQMQRSEQELIERPVPEGKLRFVCATDIIRSSVTVPSVVGVVDSLQVKRYAVDKNGVSHLAKVPVSGAEADQGKGRAGREQPGFYIPISFSNEYEQMIQRSNPEYWPQPAIQREALTSVILQIAANGLNIKSLDMLDKPDEEKITVAVLRLQKLGALGEDERITPLGEVLVNFPIDPERAKVLIEAEKMGVLPEAIIIASILENEGLNFVPQTSPSVLNVTPEILRKFFANRSYEEDVSSLLDQDQQQPLPRWLSKRKDGGFTVDCSTWDSPFYSKARDVAHLQWSEFAESTESDFYASVQAFREFKAEQKRLRNAKNTELGLREDASSNERKRKTEDAERQWCLDRSLNYKKIQFIDATVRNLLDEVANSNLSRPTDIYSPRDFSSDNFTKSLLSGLVDNVGRLNGQNYTGPLADLILKSHSSVLSRQPLLILMSGVKKSEVQGRYGQLHFAQLVAPLKPEWFMEVIPQLCEQKILNRSTAYDRITRTVTSTQETTYSGLSIFTEDILAESEFGTAVLAQALMKGLTGHKDEAHNQEVASKLKEVLKRDQSQVNFDALLTEWYISKLNGAVELQTIHDTDLELTEEILTKLLGVEFTTFYERVQLEKPSSVTLNGLEFPLAYYGTGPVPHPSTQASTNSRYYTQLELPIEQIKQLTWDDLPEIKGFDIEIYVNDPAYQMLLTMKAKRSDTASLSRLVESIEERRQDLVMNDFLSKKRDLIELTYDEVLPSLPPPEIWDDVTQSLAYPAHKLKYALNSTTSQWQTGWYRTQAEAIQVEEHAEKERVRINRQEYENRNHDVLTAEARDLYIKLMEKVTELMQGDLELYGLLDNEVRYFSRINPLSLKGKLNQAKEYAGVSGNYTQPGRALTLLHEVEVSIAEAQTYYDENAGRILEERAAKAAKFDNLRLTLGSTIRTAFVPEVEITGEVKTTAELSRICQKVLDHLPRGGMGTFAKMRLDEISGFLKAQPNEDTRLKLEQDLRQIAKTQMIDWGVVTQPQTVSHTPETSIQKQLKADTFLELLEMDISGLESIVQTGQAKDIGRWRMAVAALASKGYEGQKVLLKSEIATDALEAITKGLSKALTEATTNQHKDLQKIKELVNNATQEIEYLRYLYTAQSSPLIKEYLGDDTEAKEQFLTNFSSALNTEHRKWGEMPAIDTIDDLIEKVIEDLTS